MWFKNNRTLSTPDYPRKLSAKPRMGTIASPTTAGAAPKLVEPEREAESFGDLARLLVSIDTRITVKL